MSVPYAGAANSSAKVDHEKLRTFGRDPHDSSEGKQMTLDGKVAEEEHAAKKRRTSSYTPKPRELTEDGKSVAHRDSALKRIEQCNAGNPKCKCTLPFDVHVRRNSRACQVADPTKASYGRWYFGCVSYKSDGVRGTDYCDFFRWATPEEAATLTAKRAAKRAAAK